MDVLGFIFGMSAMSFAIIGWAQVTKLQEELKSLRIEVDKLKQQLQDSAGEGV